jgi:hypothetical protein
MCRSAHGVMNMITKAFILFLSILLLRSGDASILDWFWCGAQENASPRIKIGSVPIAKINTDSFHDLLFLL